MAINDFFILDKPLQSDCNDKFIFGSATDCLVCYCQIISFFSFHMGGSFLGTTRPP
jgi:hypothetical protein